MRVLFKEQVKGIEPSWPAWEAGVLPLNYTCIPMQQDHYSMLSQQLQGKFGDKGPPYFFRRV